jgi:N4-(beta-N-acetylglucosaminyl)-L-asparaginase
MSTQLSRREFVTVAGLGTLAGPPLIAMAESPQIITKRAVKPVVIASANGNRSKDPDGLSCVARAFKMITSGSDVLDAVVAGVNIVELDPEDTSVGYGGLPNAEGVVQLDASVMHGPKKGAGAVACIEGVRTPSLVAKAVMENTGHHLIVGRDATKFAHSMGFKIEEDLNTEKSRKLWLEWKRRTDPDHYPDPKERAAAGHRAGRSMVADGLIDPGHFYGTINCTAINAKSEICGVTTTSGLAFKIPGRVGDSPILGAGLYVDGEVGAGGSTGRGESNLFSLGSFLAVEAMRNGMSPKDAGMFVLKRIVANTAAKRLLNKNGKPNFDIKYYMLNARGEHACVSMYSFPDKEHVRYAVCDESGPRLMAGEALFEGQPEG